MMNAEIRRQAEMTKARVLGAGERFPLEVCTRAAHELSTNDHVFVDGEWLDLLKVEDGFFASTGRCAVKVEVVRPRRSRKARALVFAAGELFPVAIFHRQSAL